MRINIKTKISISYPIRFAFLYVNFNTNSNKTSNTSYIDIGGKLLISNRNNKSILFPSCIFDNNNIKNKINTKQNKQQQKQKKKQKTKQNKKHINFVDDHRNKHSYQIWFQLVCLRIVFEVCSICHILYFSTQYVSSTFEICIFRSMTIVCFFFFVFIF